MKVKFIETVDLMKRTGMLKLAATVQLIEKESIGRWVPPHGRNWVNWI